LLIEKIRKRLKREEKKRRRGEGRWGLEISVNIGG